MQALLDALRAPWSSASRFLSFYDKFPFVYFETNLQSKRRRKQIGDFLVLSLKRLLRHLELTS